MLNNKQTNKNNTTPEQFASKQKNWIRSKITWNFFFLKKEKSLNKRIPFMFYGIVAFADFLMRLNDRLII